MDTELSVGPQGLSLGDGATVVSRAGRTGEQVISEYNPRYFEQVLRGKAFSAANQTAQAVSVALATTYTGLLLYNPVGSGKILIPTKWKYAISVAPAAIATIGLIQAFSATGGVTAQTTKLTSQNCMVGNGATGAGIALSAATITTPTWLSHQVDGFTAAALSAPTPPTDYEGMFGIQPGGFIAVGALTAVTGLGFVAWIEVDYTS